MAIDPVVQPIIAINHRPVVVCELVVHVVAKAGIVGVIVTKSVSVILDNDLDQQLDHLEFQTMPQL